jgi:tetratricopeptide (TPR) repeat protein
MSSEHPDPVQWDKVAAELQAARDAQRRTWGDIDSATLGRYLADEASSIERAQVESAIEALPELKLLTDLVRDVLAESEPATPPAPVQTALPAVASVPAPTVPFRRPAPPVQKSRWGTGRQRAAVLAAACLLLGVGLWIYKPWSSKQQSTPAELQSDRERVASLTEREQKQRILEQLASEKATLQAEQSAHAAKAAEEMRLAAAAMVVEKRQHELDASLAEGDRNDVLAAAKKLSEAADNRALEDDQRFAPKAAAGWNSVGLAYADAGDYDQAVAALNRAFEINRSKLGEKHEATRQTCYRLTTVMNDGLAMRGGPGGAAFFSKTAMMPTAPNPVDVRYEKVADRRTRDEARDAFRARMNRPEMQAHVKQSLLPYLVSALQEAPSPRERVEAANALGNLGVIAQDAQPVVVGCLEQARDVNEQSALVWALNQMGPPNEQAVPVLTRTMKTCCQPELRRSVAHYLAQAPCGQAQLKDLAVNGKAEEKECACEALLRPRGGR